MKNKKFKNLRAKNIYSLFIKLIPIQIRNLECSDNIKVSNTCYSIIYHNRINLLIAIIIKVI